MKAALRLVVPVIAALALGGLAPAAASADPLLDVDLDLDLSLLGGGRTHEANLSGPNEVPGPGDPDGVGYAKVVVHRDQVCVALLVRRVDAPTAAHIHRGRIGQAGPVEVTLPAPTSGSVSGCVDVDRDLAQELRRNPGRFYVNVHNAAYPNGAVRGQLRS
ncbi:CHRD domain-containing protein [Saccharothrix violaceirubra]|uniref:CHRD domain-containing protein n=1 Tax=Saccharothrix violaceirubra TaxID=413306 RepID=A0A7W7T4H2_9PSEU|nr:CHRD domain-containing protein [Saccharothrix violaceirubra]MBB4966399.1 hypothetical protein [Saccharothrix violaceirubra]